MSTPQDGSRIAQEPGVDPQSEIQALLERLRRDFVSRLPKNNRVPLEELLAALAGEPARVAKIHDHYYRAYLALASSLLSAPAGCPPGLPEPVPSDRRFESPEWSELSWFRYLKHAYLLHSAWLKDLLEAAPLPEERKRRLRFVLRQYVDALAPTNFPASNPEVIRLATESRGESLAAGLQHLRRDLARGRIEMSEESAFEVGRNVAITPGAVVYQNPIAQLIQYTPRAARMRHRPLIIIPPFINKYYILDLQPENSFVRYALEQGLQVFLVSWRNVPRELGASTWEDYVRHGVLTPFDVALDIAGADKANVLGFCVGGTLLTSALSVMERPVRVAGLTLLATMLDFSDVGDIAAYVDEDFVRQCEASYREGGLMPGSLVASAFASLRANELVWHFVINNYLKGRAPRAFDLLHWNSDSANLPGRLFAWYLRNMYLENNLRVSDRLELCGRRVNLGAIRCPTFALAAREDHIVPWRSAYASMQLLGGNTEFVLAASGHIAGVINAPAGRRRNYWVAHGRGASPDEWLAHAQAMPGSWWPHWASWVARRSGPAVPAAPALGSAAHPPLEPAPGSYVRESAS